MTNHESGEKVKPIAWMLLTLIAKLFECPGRLITEAVASPTPIRELLWRLQGRFFFASKATISEPSSMEPLLATSDWISVKTWSPFRAHR